MDEFQSTHMLDEAPVKRSQLSDANGHAEANGHVSEATKSLLISELGKKLNGCSKSASDCLHKTTRLAREFNHGTMGAPHLILAMTLIPNASRQFELRKVDIDKAFRAAMAAIMEMERGSAGNGALPGLSEEFRVIVTLAQELAKNRDNQEVSVDDLLTALDRLPAESAAAQLIRGEQSNGPSHEVKEALGDFGSRIDQLNDTVRQMQLSSGASDVGKEISDMKDDLRRRDGYLQQLISDVEEVKKRLEAPQLPEPETDQTEPRKPQIDPARRDDASIFGRIFGTAASEQR